MVAGLIILGVVCVGLVVALILMMGNKKQDIGPALAALTEQNRGAEQRNGQQIETLRNQIAVMESGVRAAEETSQRRNEESLKQLYTEMTGFHQRSGEQITEINRIVTEKMQEILDRKLNDAFDVVVKNMNELGNTLGESQTRQRQEIAEQLGQIKEEFKAIRQDNRITLDGMKEENQKSLDKINDTVNEKLQKTLNDRISQSFEAVNQRLAEVYTGLGEMKAVASGVSDLKNVLSNVKNRGIVGEIQLSAILSDILTPDQYEVQYKINPEKRDMVDFAVKLPGQDDGYVYLPVDSKFPGDKWAALAEAYDSGNPDEIKVKRELLLTEIKTCAKSIHDKYICPPHSTDFAIMFLPFEGLYAEVVNCGMVEKLQREYHVNITGPSTMAAMLNSLQMGFRTLAIQKKSGEVWTILEAAKTEFSKFEVALNSVKNRMRQADEEMEKLVGTRFRAVQRKLRTVSTLEEEEKSKEILGIEESDDPFSF